MMNELQISNALIEQLKDYGAIKWHKTKNHSFYIKFRDVRLGSIRIANHKGREKYSYKYQIFVDDKAVREKIRNIVQSIKSKAHSMIDFEPESYVVYDKENERYKVVHSFKEYKDHIHGKI